MAENLRPSNTSITKMLDDNTSNNTTYTYFLEERDLPKLLVLKDMSPLLGVRKWVKCYCNKDIDWLDPHCYGRYCEKTVLTKVKSSLTFYSEETSELDKLLLELPIEIVKSLGSGIAIDQIKFVLDNEKIEKLINNATCPLEFLLYIYQYQPTKYSKVIQEHNQLKNNLLDHILAKKLSIQEITMFQKNPQVWAHLFWNNKTHSKWKTALRRLLELPFTPQEMLAYWLRCALGKPEEIDVRERLVSNTQLQRITDEASLGTIDYAKLDTLAHHWFWLVREAVAKNTRTAKRVLDELSYSQGYFSDKILLAVIENTNTLTKTFNNLLKRIDNNELIYIALKRYDLPITCYKLFKEHVDPKIRELAVVSLIIHSIKVSEWEIL